MPHVSQGFASGDLDKDAWSVRHFFRNTSLVMMVAQSFSKNFGLYGERVGVLHVVCRSESAKPDVLATLGRLSRAEITTPPINGAKIVAEVLEEDDLRQQWQRDLRHMNSRMGSMCQRLVAELQKRQTPGSWDHILREVRVQQLPISAPTHTRYFTLTISDAGWHVPYLKLGQFFSFSLSCGQVNNRGMGSYLGRY
jgi:hypothetical protein